MLVISECMAKPRVPKDIKVDALAVLSLIAGIALAISIFMLSDYILAAICAVVMLAAALKSKTFYIGGYGGNILHP